MNAKVPQLPAKRMSTVNFTRTKLLGPGHLFVTLNIF